MDKNYQAWWLRQQGHTWQQVADQLGTSRTSATRWASGFDATRRQGFSPDEGPDIDPMAGVPSSLEMNPGGYGMGEFSAMDRMFENVSISSGGAFPDFSQAMSNLGSSPFDLGLPIPQSTRMVPFGNLNQQQSYGRSVFGSPNMQESRTDPYGTTRSYNVFDSAFGVSLVQNAAVPHGGFIPTASYEGGMIIPPEQNFGRAYDSDSFIPTLQQQGAPYMAFAEMSPQNLAKASSMISIPGNYWNERQETLNELRTQRGMPDAVVYGAGSHAFQLGPVVNETFMRTPSGDMLGYYGVKSIQHGGVHETLAFEDAPGAPRRTQRAPFQTEDQSSPLEGVVMTRAYTRFNILTGEGQQAMRPDAGYITRYQTHTIEAPEGDLPFKVGDVFGFNQHTPRTLQEGDVWRGNVDAVPGLPNVTASSYHLGRVSDIQRTDSGLQVTMGMSMPVAGNSASKLHEKYNNTSMDIDALGPDWQGVDTVGQLPGPKYFSQWARNVASAEMSPEEVQMAFGGNVIRRDQSEAAQEFFINRAKEKIINSGTKTAYGIRVDAQKYEEHKDFGIFSNVKPQEDGSYVVDYTDQVTTVQTLNRFRPEQAQYSKLLGREELDRMAESRPEIYRNLRQIEAAGGMPNYSREIIQARNINRGANLNLPTIDANDINISQIQQQVLDNATSELSPRQLDMEVMRGVARETKGQMIRMGGQTFASASAAVSNAVLDNDGNPIVNSSTGGMNYASAMAQALRANEEFRQLSTLNDPENLGEARANFDEAINQLTTSQEILAGHESTVNRAMGMTLPMATGASQQITGIAENEGVIDRQTLFRLTNARTEAEQEMVIGKLRSGDLPITATMYPHANPEQAFAPLQGVLLEDLQKREGMGHIRLDENRVGISATLAQYFEKDFDSDYFAAFAAGKFVNGKWVGDAHKSLDASAIRDLSAQGYAREFEGIREKAQLAANPEQYWADVEKRMAPTSMDQGVADYDSTAEAKSRMGQIYNWSVRDQYVAGNMIANEAGLTASQHKAVRGSLSRLAKRPYQPALDMDPSTDPGLLAMEEFSQFASYDSSKKMGYHQGYVGGKNVRPLLESANPELLGGFLAKTFMSAGASEENWETETAPDIARGILPMNMADNEDAVSSMVGLMKGFNETGEFDQEAFLGITGRKSMAHWLVGSQQEGDLGSLSALGSYFAGAMGSRAAEKSPNYRASRSGMPGMMGRLSEMIENVRAGRPLNAKGSKQKLEDVMAALPQIQEARAAFQHSADAIEALGVVPQVGDIQESAGAAAADVQAVMTAGGGDVARAALLDHNERALNSYSADMTMGENWLGSPPPGADRIVDIRAASERNVAAMNVMRRGRLRGGLDSNVQVNAARSGGGGLPQIPGGPPGGGGGGDDSESIPGNMGSGGGSLNQHIGDRIEHQSITEANVKVPFLGDQQIGEAREALAMLKEFRGELGKLNEIQGPLTENQAKYRDALIKMSGTLEKHAQAFEVREDMIGRGLLKGGRSDADFKAFVAEDPEYWAIKDEMSGDVQTAVRRKEQEKFRAIAAEGGRMPQPSAGELFDMLGDRGTKKGRETLSQAWKEGRFDDWLGGDGEGTSRTLNRAAAMAASPLANLKNFAEDPGKISGMMWRAGLISSTLLYPSIRAGTDYQESIAERDMNTFQAGQADYNQLMEGEFGRVQRTRAMRGEGHLGMGRQIYNSYGFMFDAMGPGDNAFGAAMGIGLPALGAGALSASVLAPLGLGPVGWGIGAAALGAGSLSFAHNANQNYSKIGDFTNEVRGMAGRGAGALEYVGAAFRNFEGLVGNMTNSVLGVAGMLTEEQQLLYASSPQFSTLTDQYSRGEIDRTALDAGLAGSGFNYSQAVSSSLNKYVEREAEAGVNREASMQNYMAFSRFNPDRMMTETQSDMMRSINLSGASLERASASYSQAMGYNPVDPRMGEHVTNDLMYDLSTQPNAQLYEQRLGAMSDLVAGRNQAARLVGAANIDPRTLVGGRYEQDPDFAMISMANNAQSFDLAHRNREFYDDGAAMFYEETGQIAADTSDPMALSTALKRMGKIEQNEGIYNQLTAWGADGRTVASNVRTLSGMSGVAERRAMNMINGDPTTLSRNWQTMGAGGTPDMRYNLIDPDTGMGAYETNISREEYDVLSAYDQRQTGFGRNRLGSFEMVQGGERDMRLQIRNLQRDQMEYQFGMVNAQTTASYQMQTGGATSVNPISGFSGPGDGLNRLQGVMRQFGFNFQSGNGMGMWQIQDAQTQISRDQQIWNMQQQGVGIDRQERNFELQDRQFYEKWDMNSRQFEYSSGFQRSQMQRSRRLQVQSEDWREQDMAFDRSQTEIQTGWQMEDFDRNLRYARGRDRLDMMRQRDRSVLMNSMNMSQRDVQEERFETSREDSAESHTISMQDQRRTTNMRREEMNMQKRHYEERRALDREALDQTKEGFEKQKQWLTERMKLEDQERLIQRQYQMVQQQWTEDMNAKSQTTQVAINQLNDSLTLLGEYARESSQFINSAVSVSQRLNAATTVNAQSSTPVQSNNRSMTTPSGNMTMSSRAEQLLQQIADYGPARLNATINTRGNQSVNQLVNQAYRTRTMN